MRKLIKCISLFGFSLLFLSGCAKSNSGNKVAAAPINKAAGKETLDLNKLNPEERAQVEKVALDVKNLVRLTESADNAFRQIWKRWLGQDPTVNIFSGLNKALMSGYSEGGLPFAKSENPKIDCKKASLKIEEAQEITENKIKFQAPQTYSLIDGKCSALPGETKIQAMRDQKGRDYYTVSYYPKEEKEWVGNIISFYGFPSEKKAEGSDKKEKPVFIFQKAELASRCNLYMSKEGKLTHLACVNLGQDTSEKTAIVMKELMWEGASDTSTFKASSLEITVSDEKGPRVLKGYQLVDDVKGNAINVHATDFETGEESSTVISKDGQMPELPSDKAVQAPISKQVKPQNEATSNEPLVQSGDQAVSPDQIGLDGEVVPLSEIDTPTQDATSVR